MVFISTCDIKNFYDVIIIGAGPAGLECCRILENSNLSVLIIEKNDVIGPKVCAGGLCGNFDFKFNKESYFSSNIFHVIYKQTTNLVKLNSNNSFKIISRSELGNFQLNQISNSLNISILTNSCVTKIDDSSILLNNDLSIKFGKLVGADGSNSIVRKFLNLETKITMGLQYFFRDTSYSDIKFVFDINKLDLGYFWVFPHIGGVSIGVYFDSKIISIETAKKLLHGFIVENGIDIIPNMDLQAGPINYHYSGFEFNNIYLIGEAAGLTSYLSGEGIPSAIISGSEIANKLLDDSYSLSKLYSLISLKKIELELLSKIREFPESYKKHILSKFWKF